MKKKKRQPYRLEFAESSRFDIPQWRGRNRYPGYMSALRRAYLVARRFNTTVEIFRGGKSLAEVLGK